MPASMAETPITPIRIPPDIKAAAIAFCDTKGINLSDLVRQGICREINRPDLLEQSVMQEGRPKAPKAPPKKRSRK